VNVLLTGGAGFIGSHVADRLAVRGDRVVIVDSFDAFYDPEVKRRNIAPALATGNVSLIECDICDRTGLERATKGIDFDAVVHLAARAGVRPSLERPLDYIRTNVEGTQSVLELARSRGVRPFVMGSSSSVYGDSTPVPFRENASADAPISPYAATKRAAELICHAHAHLHGASIACLRLFTVYGPRQRPDLAIHKFAKLMLRNEEIPLYGDGSTERDYTYIDDIVDGIERALDWSMREPPGTFEIFNLGESVTTPLSRLIDLIGAELDVTPRIHWLPNQPGDVDRTFADVSRAREILGYDPRTSMEEGIHSFVEWLRAQPMN
jgi:UDP-glucuronate 4-epimerase